MKKVNNIRGFTLVEVLITAAILGLLGLVIMNITKRQAVTQKKAESGLELTSLHNAIMSTLLNGDSCRNTLSAVGNITTNTNVPNIRDRNNSVAYNVGVEYNNLLQINSIRTRDVVVSAAVPPATMRYGELTIDIVYEQTANILAGASNVRTFSIPLKIEVNTSNVVTKCYSATENAVDTARVRACTSLGGNFNVATDRCEMVPYASAVYNNVTAVSTRFLQDYVTALDLDNRYVNVTGDTMTGSLTINSSLRVNNNNFRVESGSVTLNNTTLTQTGGNIVSDGYLSVSDRTLKKNIKSLENKSEKIHSLRGVEFVWRHNGEKDYGFIAQEVEKIFPDLVKLNPETGKKAVKYVNMIPLLLEETKKLKIENDQLREENKKLQREIDEIRDYLKMPPKKSESK